MSSKAKRLKKRRLYIPGEEREVIQHTAGPLEWIECGTDRDIEFQIRVKGTTGNEPDELLAFSNEGDPSQRSQIVANMALLAMAPELSAALRSIVDCAGLTCLDGYEHELDAAVHNARQLLWMIENAPYADREQRQAS